MARRKSSRFLYRFLYLAAALAILFVIVASFRAGPAPSISIDPEMPGIGKRTPVKIRVDEPKRGLAGFRVELVQGERVEILETRDHSPLDPWEFWGDRVPGEELSVDVGSETIKGLKEGPAKVRVVAERAKGWLRRPGPETAEIELAVKLRPPLLQVHSIHTYVAQGGSETVVYKVDDSSVKDGVRAGDWWFPGYPLPGGTEGERFALFAVPYNVDDAGRVELIARDAVGNESRASFIDKFFSKRFKQDTLRLSDGFMSRVVPAILDQTPELEDRGDLLANYLMLNGELRAKNAKTLVELAAQTEPRILWSRPFTQLRNAKVMAGFADHRIYMYDGRAVDEQYHLGYDLASTRMAEITASNDGIVLMARYFGIYGNAVVIDHGCGLMSLYGHMSNMAVEEGQQVERGQVLGTTGVTGLAGGDHLHFGILLHGLPVNPTEWWDGHWIHDRLKLKLGPAFDFEE